MGEGEVHRGARGRVPRFAFHGSGEDPRRSDSARLPSVTLALAAPDPPVQLRWTTLRVQGPTLRDAALANDGDGSPQSRSSGPPHSPVNRHDRAFRIWLGVNLIHAGRGRKSESRGSGNSRRGRESARPASPWAWVR